MLIMSMLGIIFATVLDLPVQYVVQYGIFQKIIRYDMVEKKRSARRARRWTTMKQREVRTRSVRSGTVDTHTPSDCYCTRMNRYE